MWHFHSSASPADPHRKSGYITQICPNSVILFLLHHHNQRASFPCLCSVCWAILFIISLGGFYFQSQLLLYFSGTPPRRITGC
ncbi:hypothetical protein P691DRAFT_575337 [Macrolepiota fuliginosa MF-IS2]|uniref:Uncharacterized protein n=1 Tax=Macrolepiota fuliginosa MF-IS2 TaxID=1400762 RepID=A0A9P6C4X5_9AGAR|nr:hypothetical protein P691DRAFT_575337 [Macrolepiota fuliginosa MF-IS2]